MTCLACTNNILLVHTCRLRWPPDDTALAVSSFTALAVKDHKMRTVTVKVIVKAISVGRHRHYITLFNTSNKAAQ